MKIRSESKKVKIGIEKEIRGECRLVVEVKNKKKLGSQK